MKWVAGWLRRGSLTPDGGSALSPRQGQGSMALSLLFLALLAAGVAKPALAQPANGLYWLCKPITSTSPIAGYCPVSTGYPTPEAPSASSVGGGSIFRSVTLTNTAVAVDASAGTVSFIHAANTGGSAALCYLQLYDLAAASVQVGTTVPTVTLALSAATVLNLALSVPLQFSTAISAAATTTAGGGTACSPILQSTLVEYK